ncbi:unnamed protein product [Laminaria digitata]
MIDQASVEHVGEPLLTRREVATALGDRGRCERVLRRRRREEDRQSVSTTYKGPNEQGARFAKSSLLLVGEGMQGVGFRHTPDWDVYKNDDWGRRREVLRRLVNSVGAWVVRRRAGKRLAAIQARLGDLKSRAEVAAMVERDNHQAQLSAGPTADASQHSRKAGGGGSTADNEEGWDFPELLVTSEALAAEMLSQSIIENAGGGGRQQQGGGGGDERGAGGGYTRSSSVLPPPPEFRLDAGDIGHHRFPIFEEGAALSRREEAVDAVGPPTDFVDIDLLPLKEPEEGRAMGYKRVCPPGLGTYPGIETSRPLRWSAFEECGVRQPRDEEEPSVKTILPRDQKGVAGAGAASSHPRPPPAAGWRKALSSTERRSSKASLGRRRSSVGLRMAPATVENPEESWLFAAEAELTALAEEAEKVERMPDSLLLCPPPPGGVDLITPDPRFKPFLRELPMDEASPEWRLRPQNIPREVTVTKGLLLGYSPGSTTLRAYADAPRLTDHWKPHRERRSSGLACMKGQASRGVWQPIRGAAAAAAAAAVPSLQADEGGGRGGGGGEGGGEGGRGSASRGKNFDGRAGAGTFRLATEPAAAAAAAGDELSDSESEDDEDDVARPTPDDARIVFGAATEAAEDALSSPRSGTAGVPSGGHGGPGGPGGGGGSKGGTPGGGRGRKIGRGGRFRRDRAFAAFESLRRDKRESDAEVLADRMGAIGAEVRNIKHAFVLQTPYHRIRPREPKGS